MKALVMTEYGKFIWKDVEKPALSPRDALIRIRACAVCGSDVHGIDGSTGRRKPPVIMGHEAAGVIEALGDEATGWAVGDRVTFDSTVYCGECEECKNGRVNLCGNRRVLGVSCDEYKMDGAFAEYVCVPSHVLYRLPDSVSFTQAAMIEPLSIAYHAVKRTAVSANGVSAVVGAGTIGMLIVSVLRALGAKTIIAVDISKDKLDFALKNGADYALNSLDADIREQMLRLSRDGEGLDVCYDATGIEKTLDLCIGATRKGGAVVMVGNLAASVRMPLQWVVTREISLFGSCASAGEYPECIRLIADKAINTDKMISKVVPMSEGGEWISRVYAGERGLTKIVLTP